jgi:hypothetical protein
MTRQGAEDDYRDVRSSCKHTAACLAKCAVVESASWSSNASASGSGHM